MFAVTRQESDGSYLHHWKLECETFPHLLYNSIKERAFPRTHPGTIVPSHNYKSWKPLPWQIIVLWSAVIKNWVLRVAPYRNIEGQTVQYFKYRTHLIICLYIINIVHIIFTINLDFIIPYCMLLYFKPAYSDIKYIV